MKTSNEYNLKLYCRVCGYKNEDPPWGHDGMAPTFNYCPCCGVEFGYGDATKSGVYRHRNMWLNNGAKWFHPEEKPDNWDLDEQMKQIPPDFR